MKDKNHKIISNSAEKASEKFHILSWLKKKKKNTSQQMSIYNTKAIYDKP